VSSHPVQLDWRLLGSPLAASPASGWQHAVSLGPKGQPSCWLPDGASDRHVQARLSTALAGGRTAVAERAGYGTTALGAACLAARHLVEAGVRCVTLLTSGTLQNEITWDTHSLPAGSSVRQLRDTIAPAYDQAVSGLIRDLDQRGLLDQTLVCNLAEFGRSPHINPAGGRDHWPECWTTWLAGGGVQGGRVIGRSDQMGAEPADRPVHPAQIVASIRHCLHGEQPGGSSRLACRPAVGGCGHWEPIAELF
jgi:hypothetical protein